MRHILLTERPSLCLDAFNWNQSRYIVKNADQSIASRTSSTLTLDLADRRSCRQMLILRNLRRRKRHQAPDEDSGSQDNSSSRATDHTVRERQHPQQHSKRQVRRACHFHGLTYGTTLPGAPLHMLLCITQGVSSPPSQDTSDECAAVSRAVATGTGHRSGRKRRTGPWSYLLDSPQVSQLSSDSLPQVRNMLHPAASLPLALTLTMLLCTTSPPRNSPRPHAPC